MCATAHSMADLLKVLTIGYFDSSIHKIVSNHTDLCSASMTFTGQWDVARSVSGTSVSVYYPEKKVIICQLKTMHQLDDSLRSYLPTK